jgi:hypothetical protein
MFRNQRFVGMVLTLCFGCCGSATASGIDHKVTFDESGIWNRNIQKGLEYGSIAVVLGALRGKAARRASGAHSGRRWILRCSEP